ncbi:MAG: transglycosylase SLT domain-containing protein [Gemmobacter sp.]
MNGLTRCLAAVALAVAPAACTLDVSARETAVPVTRWDHRPEAEDWTRAAIAAVSTKGRSLVETDLADAEQFCPGYNTATEAERIAFWVGIFSALAKHESTWNPRASGGGGRWIGLTQIDPRTARGYGCEARTPEQLKDGAANLVCAVQIAAVQVPKDGMVAGTRGRHGLGRDWAPFRSAAKRAEMAAWTRSQPYCQT